MLAIITLYCSMVSAYYLDFSHNSPRNGDVLNAETIELFNTITTGDNVTWDFAELRVENTGKQIKYYKLSDSLIAKAENREVSYLAMSGDTISLVVHNAPFKHLDMLLPELLMAYPMGYTSCVGCWFYGEGVVDGSHYLRQAGNSCTAVEAKGRLITPDCDSLRNVLLVHRYRAGSTHISADFSKSFLMRGDSLMLNSDSIAGWLVNDSITHSIDTYSWYARGYRYPILEQNIVKTFYNQIQVDSLTKTCYFSPKMQEEELAEDAQNDSLRMIDRNEPWNIEQLIQGNGAGLSNSNLGFLSQGDCCTLSPLVVDVSTTLSYNSETPTNIMVGIYSMTGAFMSGFTRQTQDTHGNLSIDTSQLHQGEYVVTAYIGSKLFSFKIFRK